MYRTIGIAVLTLFPIVAQAQMLCAERKSVTKKLVSDYGEHRLGHGVRSQDRVFEVWVNDETTSWTILMTLSNGQSCVMATGKNWQEAPPPLTGVPG